jgi:hypothetical protein
MASPTSGPLPKNIYVKYNTTNWTVTTIPFSDEAHPLRFEPGERVNFVSDSHVALYIRLDPAQFEPSPFTPLTDGVKVKKDSCATENMKAAPKMFDCGFVQVENGVPTGYGWLPDNVKAVVAYQGGTMGIWGEDC